MNSCPIHEERASRPFRVFFAVGPKAALPGIVSARFSVNRFLLISVPSCVASEKFPLVTRPLRQGISRFSLDSVTPS